MRDKGRRKVTNKCDESTQETSIPSENHADFLIPIMLIAAKPIFIEEQRFTDMACLKTIWRPKGCGANCSIIVGMSFVRPGHDMQNNAVHSIHCRNEGVPNLIVITTVY